MTTTGSGGRRNGRNDVKCIKSKPAGHTAHVQAETRLLGMISDGGHITDINEFQEEQGITLDDDEATAVEKGEFGQPPPLIRKQVNSVKRPLAVSNRAASVASEADEGGKKKKAKKV